MTISATEVYTDCHRSDHRAMLWLKHCKRNAKEIILSKSSYVINTMGGMWERPLIHGNPASLPSGCMTMSKVVSVFTFIKKKVIMFTHQEYCEDEIQ